MYFPLFPTHTQVIGYLIGNFFLMIILILRFFECKTKRDFFWNEQTSTAQTIVAINQSVVQRSSDGRTLVYLARNSDESSQNQQLNNRLMNLYFPCVTYSRIFLNVGKGVNQYLYVSNYVSVNDLVVPRQLSPFRFN